MKVLHGGLPVIGVRYLILCAAIFVAPAAMACTVCITAPERGVAQRLIEDDLVVLARPAQTNPFQYEIVEILRGDPATIESAPEVPFLVSSVLRRRLSADPDLGVLMSYGPAEPEDFRTQLLSERQPRRWNQLLTLTSDLRPQIDQIVQAPGWGAPRIGSAPAPRFEYFAALHAHPNPVLRRMAWRELRTWPYGRLRQITPALSPAELRAVLSDKNAIPDAPLAILFLANHDSQDARDIVAAGAARALAGGIDLNLGAWVVALAEQKGSDAVRSVAEALLWPMEVTERRRQAGLDGLITAADALPELQPAVASALAEAARRHPQLLPAVAAALLKWEDGRLVQDVASLLDAVPQQPADDFLLRRYVAAFPISN